MDRGAANLEGQVQLETTTKPNAQTLYFVELLPAKSDAPMAIMRMVNRIGTSINVKQFIEFMLIGHRNLQAKELARCLKIEE